MKVFLESQYLLKIVENGYYVLIDETTIRQGQKNSLKDSRKRDKKALYLIY